MERNPYQVLGVAQNASDKEIKRRYLELAKKHHPDARADSVKGDASEKQFVEITNAYAILRDPEKRRMCDAQISMGMGGGGGGGGRGTRAGYQQYGQQQQYGNPFQQHGNPFGQQSGSGGFQSFHQNLNAFEAMKIMQRVMEEMAQQTQGSGTQKFVRIDPTTGRKTVYTVRNTSSRSSSAQNFEDIFGTGFGCKTGGPRGRFGGMGGAGGFEDLFGGLGRAFQQHQKEVYPEPWRDTYPQVSFLRETGLDYSLLASFDVRGSPFAPKQQLGRVELTGAVRELDVSLRRFRMVGEDKKILKAHEELDVNGLPALIIEDEGKAIGAIKHLPLRSIFWPYLSWNYICNPRGQTIATSRTTHFPVFGSTTTIFAKKDIHGPMNSNIIGWIRKLGLSRSSTRIQNFEGGRKEAGFHPGEEKNLTLFFNLTSHYWVVR